MGLIKPAKPKPVTEYTKLQGRFRHLTEEDLKQIQKVVDWEWDRLLKIAEGCEEKKTES